VFAFAKAGEFVGDAGFGGGGVEGGAEDAVVGDVDLQPVAFFGTFGKGGCGDDERFMRLLADVNLMILDWIIKIQL
jgi:hypothetical protein